MIRLLGNIYSINRRTFFSPLMGKRFLSSSSSNTPTVVDIYQKYKSVDELLCKLRPDKMTDPKEPERLLKEGVISAEMAEKFTEEIKTRIEAGSILFLLKTIGTN